MREETLVFGIEKSKIRALQEARAEEEYDAVLDTIGGMENRIYCIKHYPFKKDKA